MYLVYLFSFPMVNDNSNGKLFELYKTIMIFELISAILIVCQITTGARKIELQHHRELGRAVKKQGYVFLVTNATASMFYYLMG